MKYFVDVKKHFSSIVLLGLLLCNSALVSASPDVDALIYKVDEYDRAGEIYAQPGRDTLKAGLFEIGEAIDAGNSVSARELITAFSQEVNSVKGIFYSAQVAEDMVSSVNLIAESLPATGL